MTFKYGLVIDLSSFDTEINLGDLRIYVHNFNKQMRQHVDMWINPGKYKASFKRYWCKGMGTMSTM